MRRVRRLHRERSRPINERIQHVNRIKGLLAIHGIYDYEPMHPERMRRLERLRTSDRNGLPLRLKAEILRELQRLELVLEMIQTIETWFSQCKGLLAHDRVFASGIGDLLHSVA
jgi:transposase